MPPDPDTVRNRSPQAPSHRPSSSHLEGRNTTRQPDKNAEIFDKEKKTMAIPEVIGLPLDGHWDHDAAYDHRYCFQHGEDEYLLGTPASWMSPTNFRLSAAGERLEVMLEQFNRNPSVFRPHSRRHQAECTSKLWSHVDSVIKRSTGPGQGQYLIRWKACWTPRSCIDDINWLGASLRKNQNPRCQRSSRLERTAEVRTRKNEDIMRVIRLG